MMTITAFSLNLLFTIAGLASLAVLAASFRRAIAVAGELHRAAAKSEDRRIISLRFSDVECRPARPQAKLRLIGPSIAPRRSPGHPALRAAA